MALVNCSLARVSTSSRRYTLATLTAEARKVRASAFFYLCFGPPSSASTSTLAGSAHPGYDEPMTNKYWSRRQFVQASALAPLALNAKSYAFPTAHFPVGIEMYSVRNELAKDPMGTVRAVAAAGYQGLEFYAPYFEWTVEQAKDMRKLLDELKIRCFSTHNDSGYFSGDKLQHDTPGAEHS